jgi:hypothetical protein
MYVSIVNRVPKKIRWQIIAFSEDPSRSVSTIASITHIAHAIARNIFDRYAETGDLEDNVRPYQPGKTTMAPHKNLNTVCHVMMKRHQLLLPTV